MNDMVERKRRTRKFSDEVLTAIAQSDESAPKLAARYGISKTYVYMLKKQYTPGMNRSFTV